MWQRASAERHVEAMSQRTLSIISRFQHRPPSSKYRTLSVQATARVVGQLSVSYEADPPPPPLPSCMWSQLIVAVLICQSSVILAHKNGLLSRALRGRAIDCRTVALSGESRAVHSWHLDLVWQKEWCGFLLMEAKLCEADNTVHCKNNGTVTLNIWMCFLFFTHQFVKKYKGWQTEIP